ncbi:MAG: DHH family phosphoesterase, partial [Lachnospiraceae bacterium]|nr:DHH family phosphoesterase [Lachnospiraceae bacterium]
PAKEQRKDAIFKKWVIATFEEAESYEYQDVRIVGACATIIAWYYYVTDTPISSDAATALAYGIKMDTDDLIRGTTLLDMDMISFLFRFADWSKLNEMYNSTIEFQDLQAYGSAIENIEVYDFVGFTYIPFECPNALVGIISDFVLSLDVVDVAVVYSVNQNGIKFSVRSEREDVDAGKLIYNALEGIGNGGGHAAMAGGFVENAALEKIGTGYYEEIKRLFIDYIEKLGL